MDSDFSEFIFPLYSARNRSKRWGGSAYLSLSSRAYIRGTTGFFRFSVSIFDAGRLERPASIADCASVKYIIRSGSIPALIFFLFRDYNFSRIIFLFTALETVQNTGFFPLDQFQIIRDFADKISVPPLGRCLTDSG